MRIGSVDYWEIHIWKQVGGHYSPATEQEVAVPSFEPVIVFRSSWGAKGALGTPIVYEDGSLYFVYEDALTTEQVKEIVELRGDGYTTLLKEAERVLTKHFSNGSERDSNQVA